MTSPLAELMQQPDVSDAINASPKPLDLPQQTEQRNASVARVKAKLTADDLSRRGVAYYTTPQGQPKELTDPTTQQPLTNFDQKNGVAWDSSGSPKRILADPTGGTPTVQPAYQDAPTQTDKAGNIYAAPAGLPWQQTGVDPAVKAQLAAKTQDTLDREADSALAGPHAEAKSAYQQAHTLARTSAKTTSQALTGLGIPMTNEQGKPAFNLIDADPQAVRAHIEDSTNKEFAQPAANAAPLFGGARYTAAADQLRKDIQDRKQQALDLTGEHFATVADMQTSRDALLNISAQREELKRNRLASVNAKREAAGLAPVVVPAIPGAEQPLAGASTVDNTGSGQVNPTPASDGGQQPLGASGAAPLTDPIVGETPANPIQQVGGVQGFAERTALIAAHGFDKAVEGISRFAGLTHFADFLKNRTEAQQRILSGQQVDPTTGQPVTDGGAQLTPAGAVSGTAASVIGGIGGQAPGIALGGIPGLVTMGLQAMGGASAEAHDAVKNQGGSDEDATKAAGLAALKTLPSTIAFAGAGAVTSKILPHIVPLEATPIARAAAALVTNSAINVGAASAGKAVVGEDATPTLDDVVNGIVFAAHRGMTEHQVGQDLATAKAIITGDHPEMAVMNGIAEGRVAQATPEQQASAAQYANAMRAVASRFVEQHGYEAPAAKTDAEIPKPEEKAANAREVPQETTSPEPPSVATQSKEPIPAPATTEAGQASATTSVAPEFDPKLDREIGFDTSEAAQNQKADDTPEAEIKWQEQKLRDATALLEQAKREGQPLAVALHGKDVSDATNRLAVLRAGLQTTSQFPEVSDRAALPPHEPSAPSLSSPETPASDNSEDEATVQGASVERGSSIESANSETPTSEIHTTHLTSESGAKAPQAPGPGEPSQPESASGNSEGADAQAPTEESQKGSQAIEALAPKTPVDTVRKAASPRPESSLQGKEGSSAEPATAPAKAPAIPNAEKPHSEEERRIAKVVDAAMDKAYSYGRAKPGSFGESAVLSGTRDTLAAIRGGETNIEKLADIAHEGWAKTARTFDDPIYKEKPEKRAQRLKLAETPYPKLPEEEKEKDRVVARTILAESGQPKSASYTSPEHAAQTVERYLGKALRLPKEANGLRAIDSRGNVQTFTVKNGDFKGANPMVGEAWKKIVAVRVDHRGRAEPVKGKVELAQPKSDTVDAAAHEAATSTKNELPHPTDAQKEAGNYKVGRVNLGGLDISIENPAGSKRRPEWPALKSHYGYIRGTKGKDGDHIDVFIKPGTPLDYQGPVFVVNQQKRGGGFDEHKAVIGVSTTGEALAEYRSNYSPGEDRAGTIAHFPTMEAFKEWTHGASRRIALAKSVAPAPKPPDTEALTRHAETMLATHAKELAALGHDGKLTVGTTKAASGLETRGNRIVFDPAKFAEDNSELTETKRLEKLKRAMSEEVFHLGTLKYATESDTNRELVSAQADDAEWQTRGREVYGPEWDARKGESADQLRFRQGAEIARMIWQGDEKLTEASYKFLDSFLKWLKEKLGNLSQASRDLIAAIEEKMGRFRDAPAHVRREASSELGKKWDALNPKDREPLLKAAHIDTSMAVHDWMSLPDWQRAHIKAAGGKNKSASTKGGAEDGGALGAAKSSQDYTADAANATRRRALTIDLPRDKARKLDTPAAPIEREADIRTAYDAPVKETGFPDVSIADVMERAGLPLTSKGALAAMHKAGDATFTSGDWSLSSDREKAWSVIANGDSALMVRLNESDAKGEIAPTTGTPPPASAERTGDQASLGGTSADADTPATKAQEPTKETESGASPNARLADDAEAAGVILRVGDYKGLIANDPAVIADVRKRIERKQNPLGAAATKQTDTPEFKRWFGDSKAVDEDGKPLVVYHGTAKDFNAFQRVTRVGTQQLGFWFASSKEAAEKFSQPRDAGDHGRVMEVYLSIQRPASFKMFSDLKAEIRDRPSLKGRDFDARAKAFRRELEQIGYDGIVVEKSDTDGGGERSDFIAFHPTQIKSATGNSGAFDPNDPSILNAAASKSQPREEDGSFGRHTLDSLKRKLVPGLDLMGGIKQGVQSLLLPSAQSPEHLRAAEVLGSKLGPMNRRQESARELFRKDWLKFEGQGIHREGLPLDRNAGIKFMSDMSAGREMSPDLQAIADKMTKIDDAKVKLLEEADAPLQTVRENYFPGVWTADSRRAFNLAMQQAREQGILPEGTGVNQATTEQKGWVKSKVDQLLKDGKGSDKDALGCLTRTPFKGKESFRKQKVFDRDIATAFEFGLRAVSNNPVDVKMLKWAEMDRNIMANQALQEWKAKGQMKVVKLSDKIPDGWQKVNDKYGTVYGPREIEVTAKNSKLYAKDEDGRYVETTPEEAGVESIPPDGTVLRVKAPGLVITGQRIVPNAVGDILNNYLSSSLYNNRYFGRLYTGWMGMANALNQTQLGVGSAFHAGFTTMEAQISAGANVIKDVFGAARGNRSAKHLARSLGKLSTASVETAMTGDKVLNAWRKPDGVIDPKIAQIVRAVELAGGGFTMERGLQTDQSTKLISDWLNGHKLRAAMRSPVAAIEQMARPIMNWLVPRQKAGVFAHMASRIIEQNPDKPLEELTPEFRAAWNRIDARLGQVRYDRLFINNTAKNVIQGAVRAPGWSGGTIAELGGAFKDTYSFFREWQETGKVPQNIPDRVAYTMSLLITVGLANALLTYLLTGDQPNGLDYWAFRTGGKDEHGNDERFVLPTYMKDLLAYAKEPLTTLVNKSHPMFSLVGDLIRNKDYYGVQIRGEDDSAVQKALDSGKYVAKAFEPFWMRGAKRESERDAGFTRQALPLIGVMPAPKKMVQSDAERLADQYAKETIPIGGRTQAQADASMAKYRMVEKLRRHEVPDFRTEIAAGHIKPGDIPALQARAQMTPLQYQVKKLPLDRAEAVYRAGSPAERKQLDPTLAVKRANAVQRLGTPQLGAAGAIRDFTATR